MVDRFQTVIDGSSMAVIIIDTDLNIEYINKASRDLMLQHAGAILSVYPGFNLDTLTGTKVSDINPVSGEFIQSLRNQHRKRINKFIDVGHDKVHVSIIPIIDNGCDLGTAIEWWYATDYLKGQEHRKSITEITGLIDELTFQTNILAINAAVEAAHAGDSGKSFSIIASEMRDLSQRCREAVLEINSRIKQFG